MEANVNELIQKKSMVDMMVPYDGEYLSLTDLGSVILNDLNVRNYRVADEEFTDFSAEIKATYGELRSIADRAASYVFVLKPSVPDIGDVEYAKDDGGGDGHTTSPGPIIAVEHGDRVGEAPGRHRPDRTKVHPGAQRSQGS